MGADEQIGLVLLGHPGQSVRVVGRGHEGDTVAAGRQMRGDPADRRVVS